MSSRTPNGIPTISYCRILPSVNAFGPADLTTDGNVISVHEGGQPPIRYEVAQVIDKTVSDEEACELTFGTRAGAGLGAPLNPVSAFVNDAANVVVLLVGSKMTKKWQYLKRTFLPFLANEMINTISDRSQDPSVNNYKAQLTLSSFEIQDEIISDLLRPANRGLSISTTLEEGVIVQGLHRETVVDESTLRKLLIDACDNRAVQALPVGGNIDTSTGIFEFRLYQSDSGNNMVGHAVYQSRECYSRLVVVDVPSIDPLLANSPEELRLLAGPALHKSLLTFVDVAKKLNNPYRAQIAPFRSAKLPHYLSELLGGNAIVVAMGQVIPGEPATTKRTLELIAALNSAIHYPMGARELSDSLRGLLGKYRAMLMHMQDEMNSQLHLHEEHSEQEKSSAKLIEKIQKELAQAITDKNAAIEDRTRIFEMTELLKAKYNTVMEEKLKQSEQLAQVEEDNIALAKTIVELNLKISTDEEQREKEKFEWNVQILQKDAKITALEEDVKQLHETIENQKDELAEKSQLISGNSKVINELKDQLEQKINQLNEQKEKNVELGAELLTLVNRKEVLQQEFDDIKVKYEDLAKDQAKVSSKEEALEDEVRKLLEKVLLKDEEIMDLRKAAMEANESMTQLKYELIDMKRESEQKELTHLEKEKQLEAEQEELKRNSEQLATELAEKEKHFDEEQEELKRNSEKLAAELAEKEKHFQEEQEEMRRNAEKLAAELAEKENAPPVIVEVVKEVPAPIPPPEPVPVEEKNIEVPQEEKVDISPRKKTEDLMKKAVDVMKSDMQEKKEKQMLRKQFELEKQLSRLTNDFNNEKQVNQDLNRELQSLQSKYKESLRSTLLLQTSSSTSSLNGDEPASSNQKHAPLALGSIPTDHALTSLLGNYERREKLLQSRNQALFQSRSEVINSYRSLYDHYKKSMETTEDMLTILTDPRYKSNDKKMGIDLKLQKLVEDTLKEQYTFSLEQVSLITVMFETYVFSNYLRIFF